jgi:TRAP-type uncharacterized transport system fused permease subunit
VFLIKPAFSGAKKNKLSFWVIVDWVLAGLSIYCTYYICGNLSDIFDRQGDWLFQDRVVSILGVLLVLEACRRVIGIFMTLICALSITYAMLGPYMA